MNELEQIKKDLRKALKRVGEISRLEALFNGINYNDLKEYIRLSNICLNKIEKEIEDKKQVTLNEILYSNDHGYCYDYSDIKKIFKHEEYSWMYHTDTAEAEHEMWRLILKRVAQYLNQKHGEFDFDPESSDKFVFNFYIDIYNDLQIHEESLPILKVGKVIFGTEKAIDEAIRIIGQDNIKRALSEEYCRNNPKTE